MIGTRFPWRRRGRIAAWTALALTWTTALIARTVGSPEAAAPPPVMEPLETVAPTTTTAAVPEPPEDGLVVLRYTPTERPEPGVQRVIVTQPAPNRPISPTPTTQRSSGS